ncbi:MAG: hypothetical protein V4676_04585, partial [Bacteroidota bacterium]
NEKKPNPKQSFFKFDYPHFTLDFLPKMIGDEKFITFYQRREIVIIEKTEIYFMGYEDLIANKIKTARPKDLDDIEQLRKIKKDDSPD